MEETFISVIIPTFKSPECLDLCLKSAIDGQTQKNQIIVVVDGHYDVNQEVLENYSKHIEVLTLPDNVGLCRATNLGVYNAKHDKILIVNDDNVFPRNWDTRLLSHWNPNFVIAPNQIEPFPSMFRQFLHQDLGRDPVTFDLEQFWRAAEQSSQDRQDATGSTLPIFMSREKYIAVGGWDENYEMGMVADWDFFLKCRIMGLHMMRAWNCNFYHFVSVSTTTPEKAHLRNAAEHAGHRYAEYKWGKNIKHDPVNNNKYL
jgi:glycosyltransferase involved in cell wall biosynthesis